MPLTSAEIRAKLGSAVTHDGKCTDACFDVTPPISLRCVNDTTSDNCLRIKKMPKDTIVQAWRFCDETGDFPNMTFVDNNWWSLSDFEFVN